MTNRTHPPTTNKGVVIALAEAAAAGTTSSHPLAVVAEMAPMPIEPEQMPVDIDEAQTVYALQMAGYSPHQIALARTKALGRKVTATDVALACKQVAIENTTRTTEQLAFSAQLDLDRIDALIQVLWPQAQDGNHQAIDRLERLMRRRAEMLGTDAPNVRVALRLGGEGVDLTVLSTDELREYKRLQEKASTAARTKVIDLT